MLSELDPSQDPVVGPVIADTAALPSFDAAARATLRFLQQQLPVGAWMVTRVSGPDWVVLRVLGEGYPVGDRDVFRWSDSMCSRMVRGEGPRVAPSVQAVQAYAAAPIGTLVQIGGYIGIPLTGGDGTLLGTLCAIDPAPLPDRARAMQDMLELQARLLASLLDLELGALRRVAVRPAQVVPPERRDDVMLQVRDEVVRHASPAAALVLAGLRRRDEPALLSALTSGERAVRLDQDLCAVLLPEVPEVLAQRRATGVLEQLHQRGVSARVGVAGVDPRTGDLHEAVERARRDLPAA